MNVQRNEMFYKRKRRKQENVKTIIKIFSNKNNYKFMFYGLWTEAHSSN